ncbi:hypothetical protein ACHHYP_02089 [Achlya hypogyna]|uniref:Serine protease n=1 Tax=Achlya hypogyna TaxID=1202772 RepID=A0A1V9Z7E6_ACHHY|nr:hypothetical protein ACHHYP_02089 [Achlya hypogyna]
MAPQFGFYNVPPTVTVVLRAIDNATTDLTPLLAPSTNRSVLLGPRLYTNYFVVEVSSSAPVCNEAGFGLSITGVVVTTFADLLVETKDRSKSEDFCGTDSSQHIVCKYSKANPQHSMYAYGRPVARLLINAASPNPTSCSGWLWGSDGHFITNNHCIGSQSDADNTQFQFVAESYLCDGILGAVCPGVTEAMSATLVRTNARLDYALLKLNAALPAKYGYLQASTASISVGTAIYIPQHPRAGCKLISNLDDSKAPTTVTSINAPGCSGKGGITYNADTDGGSSGSPVISVATNAVLALHYCGGASCMNTGMQMSRIIADLAPLGLMPANAIASGLPPVIPPFADPTINPLSLGPPFVKQAVIDGVIAQVGSVDKWQTTVDHINFHLAAPGQVIVDVLSYEMSDGTTLFQDVNGDCRIAYFDPVVYVFSNDSKVTYTTYVNDDSNSVNPEDGKADGSISYHDSYLVASLPAGSHTVAIGVTNLGYKDAVTGSNTFSYTQFLGCTGTNTTGGVDGAYRLTLSATVPLTITHAKPTPKMATCTTGDQAVVVDKCVTQFNALWAWLPMVAATAGPYVPPQATTSVFFVPVVEGIGAVGSTCAEPPRKGWQSIIFFESNAVAMRFRFTDLFLPPGDDIVLRATDGTTFALSTIFPAGMAYANVWTPRVFANLWTIELTRRANKSYCSGGYGFRIDGYSYFTSTNNAPDVADYETGCGLIDHSVHAICGYNASNVTNMYAYSRPVVRIWIPTGTTGFEMCTGWLWGSQGHVLTASHCIGSALEARLAQFEFLAEVSWCDANREALCSGYISTVSATWVATNRILDYTLLLLSSGHDLASQYGFLQVHPTLRLKPGIAVYIPQHPLGGCKRISYLNQMLRPTTVTALTAKGCDIDNDGFYRGGVVYDCDTGAGSSGSPVIESNTNTVVALHYCGNAACQNAGIPMALIVRDLEATGALPLQALLGSPPTPLPAFADPVVVPRLNPPPFVYPAIIGNLRRLRQPRQPLWTSVDSYELVVSAPTKVTLDFLVYELNLESGNCFDLIHDCRITYADTIVYVFAKFKNGSKTFLSLDSCYLESYAPYSNQGVGVNPYPPTLGTTDGSISKADPYLVATLPAGRHIVAFGLAGLSIYDAQRGINTNPETMLYEGAGANSDRNASIAYQMTISSTAPIEIINMLPLTTLPPTCELTEAEIEATCHVAQVSSGSQSDWQD